MSKATDFAPIEARDFETRTGLNLTTVPGCADIERIVSPKDITVVSHIHAMPVDWRNQLLASIGLASDRAKKVYKDCEIHMRHVDPRSLELGQKFVYRDNYVSIVESFRNLFEGFSITAGFARLSAYLIVGTDEEGRRVLGNFLPPIVEQHGGRLILMDGVHRTYLARQAGYSIECLVAEGVNMIFPCTPHCWRDVSVATVKPLKVEDRYWDLDSGFFRDVKHVGIDG